MLTSKAAELPEDGSTELAAASPLADGLPSTDLQSNSHSESYPEVQSESEANLQTATTLAEPFAESPAQLPPAEQAMAAAEDSQNRQINLATLELAIQDARTVLEQQQQLRQLSLTQLNILFVVNTALLTILSISRLIFSGSWFSFLEIGGFSLSFSLLIYALLPRPFLITPKLEDETVLESYLALSPDIYRLQMLTNLRTVYGANKQRLDDITQALALASYALWLTVLLILTHISVTAGVLAKTGIVKP